TSRTFCRLVGPRRRPRNPPGAPPIASKRALPGKTGTHTPCPIGGRRSMGPACASALPASSPGYGPGTIREGVGHRFPSSADHALERSLPPDYETEPGWPRRNPRGWCNEVAGLARRSRNPFSEYHAATIPERLLPPAATALQETA